MWFWAAKNKAKQTQFRLAPRPALGVDENQVEKTKFTLSEVEWANLLLGKSAQSLI